MSEGETYIYFKNTTLLVQGAHNTISLGNMGHPSGERQNELGIILKKFMGKMILRDEAGGAPSVVKSGRYIICINNYFNLPQMEKSIQALAV